MESDNSRSIRGSRTGLLSCTAGIRESRKFFGLAHLTQLPDDDEESLEVLLKLTWTYYGVSALFNFIVNDEVQCKRYAKKLREEVASTLTQEDVSYDAKIGELYSNDTRESQCHIIKVEVTAQATGRQKRYIYLGYLLQWGPEVSNPPPEGSTRLPLLLCRGNVGATRVVHSVLGMMFDCTVVALPLDPEDLCWLLGIMLSPSAGLPKPKDEVAILDYFVPGLPKNNTVSVSFNVRDLVNLWKSLLKKKDEVDLEDVEKFYGVLRKQIRKMCNLQLGLCTLFRITLPSLVISNRQMKITKLGTVSTILTFLNEKAVDALHFNTSPTTFRDNNSNNNL
ncbi:hypothetical protein QAD02_014801 [Eretmocerus hayati]|uniref:Uncharacterized protein n=1 Tax=Eretmocerus hayati TaxID=131215 RepID=A0ACC2P604_9HYME|nr:hypothetical protein QAD02_014801 [Eretmocerus hayati]